MYRVERKDPFIFPSRLFRGTYLRIDLPMFKGYSSEMQKRVEPNYLVESNWRGVVGRFRNGGWFRFTSRKFCPRKTESVCVSPFFLPSYSLSLYYIYIFFFPFPAMIISHHRHVATFRSCWPRSNFAIDCVRNW